MRSVYKYVIPKVECVVSVPMIRDAQVIHVHEQNGDICLWALVELSRTAFEHRVFYIRGSGHSVEDDLVYLGTAHIGPYIWHVFESIVRASYGTSRRMKGT